MGAVFTLVLVPLIAAILLIGTILIISGCLTLAVGGTTKLFLHDSKLNIISNIILILGFSLIWLALFGVHPLIMAVVCFTLSGILIAKYEEVYLLKLYIPMMLLSIILGFPPLFNNFPYIQLTIMLLWCFVYIVGFLYLVFKVRIVKEGYSFVLFTEGTISLMWLLWTIFSNYIF